MPVMDGYTATKLLRQRGHRLRRQGRAAAAWAAVGVGVLVARTVGVAVAFVAIMAGMLADKMPDSLSGLPFAFQPAGTETGIGTAVQDLLATVQGFAHAANVSASAVGLNKRL